MIGTVIKHEFLRTRSMIALHYAVATVVVGLAAALAASKWPVVSTVAVPVGVSAISALLIGVIVLLAVDYWRTSYGRMGYFTQSLPIRGRTLFAGKLLHGVAVALLTVVVCVLLGLLMWLGIGGVGEGLAGLWSWVSAALPWWAWVGGIALLVLTMTTYVAQAYFAASVGSEARLQRLGTGGPVLVWLAAYLVLQGLSLLGLFLLPLGVAMDAGGRVGLRQVGFTDLVANPNRIAALPLGFALGMAVFLAAVIWRTAVSWERKVSLA